MHGSRIAIALFACLLLVAPLRAARAASDGLDWTGDVRIRLRHVDSRETGTLEGTYGEALSKGFSLRHRFVLETAYPLTDRVRVGGMLRVSNEDPAVLEDGPDYLSSQFGSAFVSYETTSLRSRFGYYTTFYTPLTLMRWDVRDDPEGGSGCGCSGGPAAAGAILGETLEELGPKLTFEGARVAITPEETFGFDGFFARPRVAGSGYQVITFGGKANIQRYSPSASSFFDVGAIALRSEEDKHSMDGAASLGAPLRNTVYGLSLKAPLHRSVALDGEWVLTESAGAEREHGRGGIVSLDFIPAKPLKLEATYIYLSPGWHSYFRALSYNPDRQGLRARVEFESARLSVALFGRYLRTVDAGLDTAIAYPTLSVRGRFKLTPALDFGLASVYSGSGPERGGITFDADTKRLSLVGTAVFEFARDSAVTLEQRLVWNRSRAESAGDQDYNVSLTSIYVRAAIW